MRLACPDRWCADRRGTSVCSAPWERCPLWPPRYANSIRGALAPAATAATPGSPPDCGEAQLSPSRSGEAPPPTEPPGRCETPYQICASPRDAPSFSARGHRLPRADLPVLVGTPGPSCTGLRRAAPARRRPRAIAPGHSKAPPAGKDRGRLVVSREQCSVQVAGWSWWRACSASSMTPTSSMCGGSARRVATSLRGVSTGMPATYSSPKAAECHVRTQHRDDRHADRLGELVGLPPHGRPGRTRQPRDPADAAVPQRSGRRAEQQPPLPLGQVRRDQRKGRRQHLIQVHIANLQQPLTLARSPSGDP